MKIVETWLFPYLLNSLWQVPLLFCAALGVARLARKISPQMEHRIWVGTLLLQILLPLCNLQIMQVWQWLMQLLPVKDGGGRVDTQVQTFVTRPVFHGFTLDLLPAQLLAVIAVVYLCSLIFFTLRMALGVWKIAQLRNRASRLELSKAVRFQLGAESNMKDAEIVCSSEILVPATMGIQQQTLLMPAGFADELRPDDLCALLAHEFAHMGRNDYLKNLFYNFLSLPIAYHPLRALTLMRIAETREIICDQLAAKSVGNSESYARSLLRLATLLSGRTTPNILHAIGIFDANNFERRIMNLTHKGIELGGLRRVLIVTTCVLIAIATCASAMALRIGVANPQESNDTQKNIQVKQSDVVVLTKVQPKYPAEAKANKDILNGEVVLSVVIGKDGEVEHIEVARSLRADYDKSAMDAVRFWRWQPYLINGSPVSFETNVTITYSIEE